MPAYGSSADAQPATVRYGAASAWADIMWAVTVLPASLVKGVSAVVSKGVTQSALRCSALVSTVTVSGVRGWSNSLGIRPLVSLLTSALTASVAAALLKSSCASRLPKPVVKSLSVSFVGGLP